MGKVINFEESVNVMKIREEGLQNLISELKKCELYEESMSDQNEQYKKAKEILAVELEHMPDLPMARILYIAPLISKYSNQMKRKLLDDRKNNVFESDEFWTLNYLLELYENNADKVIVEGSYEEEESDFEPDMPLVDLLDDISVSMEFITSKYGDKTYNYNSLLNKIYIFSIYLAIQSVNA